MKKYLVLSLLLYAAFGFSQNPPQAAFLMQIPGYLEEDTLISGPGIITVHKNQDSNITKIIIRTKEPGTPASKKFALYFKDPPNDTPIGTVNNDGKPAPISTSKNLIGNTIEIKDDNKATVANFTIDFDAPPKNPETTISIDGYLQELLQGFSYSLTRGGLVILSEHKRVTAYPGKGFVHLFFDQYGNSLLTTIPQGMADMQYVVHVIYRAPEDGADLPIYTVNQTSGDYSGSLVFNGSIPSDLFKLKSSAAAALPVAHEQPWAQREFLLSTSTSDISFEIVTVQQATGTDASSSSIKKTVLAAYTIKMAKTYHGSFNVALLESELADPSFDLVPSPADPTKTVVKEGSSGNRGMTAAMVTFYTSPVIIIESLVGIDVPNYKLTGRNYLDDHRIWERLYPTVGIGLNDKAFENLFFGLSWECVRGGSIFAGFHYGRVSTFDKGSGLEFGQTLTSSADYNLRLDKRWKYDWAFGVSLDVTLITGLFSH